MRKGFLVALIGLWAGTAFGQGIMVPVQRHMAPPYMKSQSIKTMIDEQAAVTDIEQVFHNPNNQPVEVTYVFPVPRGAGVQRFTMSVDGKLVDGELVDATKARQIYTDIVRQTRDPGLLEYIGQGLIQIRVFPVPARSDQKVGLRLMSVLPQEAGLIEYVYPLKTDPRLNRTLELLSMHVTIKSAKPIQGIFSPTHAVTVERKPDRSVEVDFDRRQMPIDKDFQLFYSVGKDDVGITVVPHKPLSSEPGYAMILLNPSWEENKDKVPARDVVLVMDTSGSMAGIKIDQARKAMAQVLKTLNPRDRFALVHFSTTVTKYRDQFMDFTEENRDHAGKWIENLRASGGTALDDALKAAVDFRKESSSDRLFTVLFFTDGQPTIGEANPDKILKRFVSNNQNGVRVFTFGVGDDVNTMLLDQIAEESRAASIYVRPAEDIEVKASSVAKKISQPALTDLKLTANGEIRFEDLYPVQLPDLFHGSQLAVFTRYTGKGTATLILRGKCGSETREYSTVVEFPQRSGESHDFVEPLWARRKIGYLMDQVRKNGDSKELLTEIVSLSTRYGIATPYTSYLIVPDTAVPNSRPGAAGRSVLSAAPEVLRGGSGSAIHVVDLARSVQAAPADIVKNRNGLEDEKLKQAKSGPDVPMQEAAGRKAALDDARGLIAAKRLKDVQTGKLGVDIALESKKNRDGDNLVPTCVQQAAGRRCVEYGGVWIDEAFDAKTNAVTVKAQSEAYFQLLEREPKLKELFRLGNYLVWVSPSGSALVIDAEHGSEKLSADELSRLFQSKPS